MTTSQLIVRTGACLAILAFVLGCTAARTPQQPLAEACVVAPEDIPDNRRRFTTTMPVETLLDTERLQICAESGSLPAQTVLAVRLLTGKDIDLDKPRGERLLRDLAENKRHPDAMYNLGAGYAAGIFGDADDALALEWFEQAAEAGDPNGLYWVGFFYWTGRAVEPDPEKALAYFEKAAEKKHSQAAFMLGQAYHLGDAIEKDYDKAMEWYKKADTWAFNQPAQWNMVRLRQQRQREAQNQGAVN